MSCCKSNISYISISAGQSAYSRPYEGLISADPTEEEVIKLIVNKNERPAFKKELSSNEVTNTMAVCVCVQVA